MERLFGFERGRANATAQAAGRLMKKWAPIIWSDPAYGQPANEFAELRADASPADGFTTSNFVFMLSSHLTRS
jgi:hypothetical protein